jgi:hypothetical protein
VSPLDWTNTRRTFEGGKLTARARGLSFDGFWTQPVVIRLDGANLGDEDAAFSGISVRPAAPGTLIWETYVLRLEQDPSSHDRLTVGGRFATPLGGSGARVELEGAWQGGTLGDDDISAFFVASDLTRSFAETPLRPTVGVGLDYASGDGDAEDGTSGTFNQLFPLGHAFAGYMDVLGRQNLIEIRGVATATPIAPLQLRLSGHRFLRASVEDAAYNLGGGVLRAPSGSPERAIGTEIDALATYRASQHSRLELGYGHFFPGAFMGETPGGAADSDWGYAAVILTF